MDINWTEIALTAGVIFFASAIHGITGFGQSMIAIGLLPLFRNAGPASVIVSIVAVITNARVWWSVRDNFRWKNWLVPICGSIAGLPVGIYIFKNLDDHQLRIVIGIILVLAVLLISLVDQFPIMKKWIKRTGYKPDWKFGVTAGFLSGLLCGAVAIPGPPIILYGAFMLVAGFWSGREMKAIFTAFFGAVQLYRLIALAVTGAVTLSHLVESAIVLPGLLFGSWVGIRIYNITSRKHFRWIVLVLLAINAIILLIS